MNKTFATDRVVLPEGSTLFLSPTAAPIQFVTKGSGLAFDSSFSMGALRTQTKEGASAIHKDPNTGEHYYRPYWIAFTALLDCDTTRENIRNAIKLLARVPLGASAPEIGAPHDPSMAILNKGIHPSQFDPSEPKTNKAALFWNSDAPMMHYLRALSNTDRQALIETKGSQLLESALLTRRFLAADMLWESGARLNAEAKASGRALLAFCESAYGITPSLMMVNQILQIKEINEGIDQALSDGDRQDYASDLQRHQSISSNLTRQALTMGRWLHRLVEDGIDVNATFITTYKTQTGEHQAHKRALEMFVENSDLWNQTSSRLRERVFSDWTTAMVTGGFDMARSVSYNNQEMGFEEWVEYNNVFSNEGLGLWRGHALKNQLEAAWQPGGRPATKPRF